MTKLLGISGSLRRGSYNSALLRAATKLMPPEATLEVASIRGIPLYDYDVEVQGMPAIVTTLKEAIVAVDGVLLVTPEYNSSVPPLVKNTIDWITRVQDANEPGGQGFREKPFAIAAASESRLGGSRALSALRLILSACQATVIPSQLALSFADQAYDDMDRLKNPSDIEAMRALVRQLIEVSQRTM